MYEKLSGFIDEPQHDERFIKQSDFLMALPKSYNAKMGDIRELFDSVTKDDLLAIRKNLCKGNVYFETDLELEFGKIDEISHYALLEDSTWYCLKHYNSNKKKFF